MKVLCRKIISPATGEDLGEASPWLIKGKEYVVLAYTYIEKVGFDIYIQTEDQNEPGIFDLTGFEVVSSKIPSTWVVKHWKSHGRDVVNFLPESWNYDTFFEDIENQDPKAIELFNQEAEKIYREEGLID